MRSLKFSLAFVIALLIVFALPAQGHTELVSSNPAANATLTDFPADVALTFNEKLLIVGNENPNKVEVFDETGKLLSGASVVTGEVLSAPAGINGNGVFTVKYHVAAQDGHVVEGSYSFTVESDIAISSPMPISVPVEEKEDGPNLLVRVVGMAVLGGVVLILLRRAKSSNE